MTQCFFAAKSPFALAKTTGQSHQAVAYIKKLYLIEQQTRNNHYTSAQRYELRLQQALGPFNLSSSN